MCTLLVLSSSLHNAQDVDKEVDEIQVKVDCSHDVLLWRKLVHDDVSVKYDEATEHYSTSNGEYKLQCLTPKEHLHEE